MPDRRSARTATGRPVPARCVCSERHAFLAATGRTDKTIILYGTLHQASIVGGASFDDARDDARQEQSHMLEAIRGDADSGGNLTLRARPT